MVYDANAHDPVTDGGPSNPLVYTLGGTDATAFSINSSDGKVTLTGNPDYETKSSYSFDVTATDAAGNHTTQTVSLAITNLDEVPPVFDSGATATDLKRTRLDSSHLCISNADFSLKESVPSNPLV